MKKNKTIYLLSPKINWKTYKLLQDKLVKDSGPVPVNGDKVLWGMLREKMIYCWFEEVRPNMGIDVSIGTKLPKNVIIKVIK